MADPTTVAASQNEASMTAHSKALLDNLKNSSTAKVAARVFRMNIISARYVFKNGKVAPFLTKNGINSEYATNIEHEIQELDAEISQGHPNISSKPEEVLAAAAIEPLEALKKKHFEEFLKMQAATVLKSNDAGSSLQTKLNVANSTTIGEGAASSDSVVAAAPKVSISLPSKS